MKLNKTTLLAGIEYAGVSGSSEDCQNAVIRLIQFGDHITQVRILTSPENIHGMLLTVGVGDLVAVKSGFASGYGGEGPNTFSYILQLLDDYDIEIEEYKVDNNFIKRLDDSRLTQSDIDTIEKAKPVRPKRLYDYIFEKHWDMVEKGRLWEEFPPIIPFAIIEQRLTDLAISFWKNPDDKLLTAYRRLEDIVRERTGTKEHGAKLFSQVFQGDKAKLGWENISKAEQEGRALLFTGAYMTYRNPRAHKEQKDFDSSKHLAEFLLLNQLFLLEKESVKKILH